MTKEEILHAITMVRHTQLIQDPFPKETEEQRNKNLRFFRYAWRHHFKEKEISIWEAYMKGYDKAYQEIRNDLWKHLGIEE